MCRVLIGIISAAGGLIIGGFGGRKTSNITMEDVIAAPGKAGSAVLSAVKKTGRKIGSGLSSLVFWKKKKEVKKGKVNLKQDHKDLVAKHQVLSEKHTKLSDDFSETAKRMNLVEVERDDYKEEARQAKEMNTTFQNTVDEKDEELTKAAADLKQETANKQKAVSDLKIAQTALAKLEKSTSES